MTARGRFWLLPGAAVLAWLPFITTPLTPDEGGFLLVASQWGPGSSLYGHYWVDRPPLLISIFDVAVHLGGALPLRLIGVLSVCVSIMLARRLTHVAAERPGLMPAVVAAVFLSTPMFGTTLVNGELLAVPFVLASVVAQAQAWTSAGGRQALWSLAAGAAAAAAPMVKQNEIDGVVVAVALLVAGLVRSDTRRSLRVALWFTLGAAVMTICCLAWAEKLGTEPIRLWDALVAFRAQATGVIGSASSSGTSVRFARLLAAVVVSAAPWVVVVLWRRARGGPAPGTAAPDLRPAALAMLAWEAIGVAAGGSYWLHYLLGVVPGMVVLAVAAHQRPPRLTRATTASLVGAAVSAAVAVLVVASAPTEFSTDAQVSSYLREHSRSGDSVVVGFGHPDIVWNSGLPSPYPQLWSLPVRVRDPHLTELTRVLRSGHAPTWVVVSGDSLATWGVDAARAQHVLERRYQPTQVVGEYRIWRRSTGAVR